MEMTKQQLAFFVAKVHPVASAVAEILTRSALTCFHPFAVAIGEVASLPYLHEVVLIDIPLMVVGTDAGTGADCAVGHHRAYGDASLT